MFKRLVDLLFPPKCAFCTQILSKGEYEVCSACRKNIAFSEYVNKDIPFVKIAVGAFKYEDTVREAVHRYKFSGKQ